MFKNSWEKVSVTYQLPDSMVERMINLAYPDKKLTAFELIAGGCANLNYKIQLENVNQPLILRLYLRSKAAAYQEQKLATFKLPDKKKLGRIGSGKEGDKLVKNDGLDSVKEGSPITFSGIAMCLNDKRNGKL